ncbi:MAG: DUF2785 domain-containing protein [Lysobacterales bacterium]
MAHRADSSGRNRLLAVSLLLVFGSQTALAAPCPPAGYSRDGLLELKDGGFELQDASMRDELALGLAGCTGDPDPAIRDGVAYEALAGWMRGGMLSIGTVEALGTELLGQLAAPEDPQGFRRPFAALILSEVARTDRIEPTFTAARREEFVQAAAAYLSGVRDYRGFSETEGWRHGVAHGADLALQLVLNPNIDTGQVQRLLDAVATQVAPPGEHFYIYGEPGRLARPVFYAFRRGDISEETWRTWFDRLADPTPMRDWSEAFSSQEGLARRHNTLAFLQALCVAADSSGEPDDLALQALAVETLSAMP